MDLRPDLEAPLAMWALPATVTVPDGAAVETEAFWLPPKTVEVPVGNGMVRAEERHVLVLPRADVPQVPRGTIVSVAEAEGEDVQEWRVDAMDRVHVDHYRVVVVANE